MELLSLLLHYSGNPIMTSKKKSSRALIPTKARALTAKEFLDLADVPPEIEWFANITNPQTRRAYQNDLKDFMRFARITNPEVFRVVTRAHLIAWRSIPSSVVPITH